MKFQKRENDRKEKKELKTSAYNSCHVAGTTL